MFSKKINLASCGMIQKEKNKILGKQSLVTSFNFNSPRLHNRKGENKYGGAKLFFLTEYASRSISSQLFPNLV